MFVNNEVCSLEDVVFMEKHPGRGVGQFQCHRCRVPAMDEPSELREPGSYSVLALVAI